MGMQFKSVRSRLMALLGLWLIAANANSALISTEPNVWLDTETNLEWLSLKQTTTEALGLTDPGAELSTTTAAEIMATISVSDYVLNQGFSVAKTSEVAALYNGSGGVPDFTGGVNVLPEVMHLGITTSWVFQGPFYQNEGSFDQAGLHVADDGLLLRNSYVHLETADQLGDFFVQSTSYAVGNETDPNATYSSYQDFFPNNETGVYLVRSVVPVPPALYLFGSALVALWRVRRSS